jgi:hypothetical protein
MGIVQGTLVSGDSGRNPIGANQLDVLLPSGVATILLVLHPDRNYPLVRSFSDAIEHPQVLGCEE